MKNNVKQRLAVVPQAMAALTGLTVILLFLAGFTAYFANDKMQQMQAVKNDVVDAVGTISHESTALLIRLNQLYKPKCSDENLKQFRLEIFATAYQGDIGVFDEQGRLLCSSMLGKLPQPVTVQPPDISFISALGYPVEANFGMTILAGGGRFKTSLVKMGLFNIVVTPKVMDLIFAKGADVIMLHPEAGVFQPVYVNPVRQGQWLERLQQDDVLSGSMNAFNWGSMAFILSQRVGNSYFYVQSVTPVAEFLREYRWEFLGAWLASLMVGGLMYGASLPVFRSWRTMEHRIDKLLTLQNLICVYQPIVDLKTGLAVGCEVLMRLRDGNGDMIYPDVALPAVVKQKLTWRLDQLVVTKAIAELGGVLVDRHNFKVSFNFFPENINNQKIRELIEGALAKLEPMNVKFDLEVIEEMWQHSIVRELTDLKTAGYLVSVDDFGTGYSNLSSIKKLLPDFLKIDKSFVFDMEENSLRSTLIPEIVGIAHAVGAKVIAEGIENEAQWRMLLAFGVEYGQGYYFARPMPLQNFAAYLAEPVAPLSTLLDGG